MPYRICKTFEIESGHMLSKHPDDCRFPHGHSRKVEFVLEADSLDANDMVCDFKVIKEAIAEFVNTFDHALCMNTDDPQYETMKKAYGDHVIGLDRTDPTTEVLARTMHDALHEGLSTYRAQGDTRYPLSEAVRIVRVRVWETATAWAEYRP